MNSELRSRIKEAKQYEMLALRALLPKESRGHIEVIEKEVKAMLLECVLDFVKQENVNQENVNPSRQEEGQVKKVKKVTIG